MSFKMATPISTYQGGPPRRAVPPAIKVASPTAVVADIEVAPGDPLALFATKLAGLMGVALSGGVYQEWLRAAVPLRNYRPEEVLGAMAWAVKESDFWSDWNFDMEKFVSKFDKIRGDYLGVMRKRLVLERQANGETFSVSCRKLMAKWPGQLLQSILDLETKERVEIQGQEYKKTVCKVCKGKQSVPSPFSKKNKNLKGVMVPCSACENYKTSIWAETRRQVFQELYAHA
jgi:RNase P subunit RPR2